MHVRSSVAKSLGKEQLKQNMFAGSSKLAALLNRGVVKQEQIDARIGHYRELDSNRHGEDHSSNEICEHRSKRYKSFTSSLNPVAAGTSSSRGSKRKADFSDVSEPQWIV